MTHSQTLSPLLESEQTWLMRRILYYAKKQGFAAYTSTLEQAWQMSIQGLTSSICAFIARPDSRSELTPDLDYMSDPVSKFGLQEAMRHRARGISLSMFLGLFKYYRQTYLDLLEEKISEADTRKECQNLLDRAFDRIEIAFCVEWSALSKVDGIQELQNENRKIVNEKNAYLTAFESLPNPLVFVDPEGRILNLNHRAMKLISRDSYPGAIYYGCQEQSYEQDSNDENDEALHREGAIINQPFEKVFPWLEEIAKTLKKPRRHEEYYDAVDARGEEKRYYEVRVSGMLDVSDKFIGALVTLVDVTERTILTEKLNHLATTDSLTGAYNRREFFSAAHREFVRSQRNEKELTILLIDIDEFKLVNDSYGHQVGDQVLSRLVEIGYQVLRASDILARIGGEEFAVVLPETGLEDATAVAERLRIAFSKESFITDLGPMHVTASIGVAMLMPTDQLVDDVVRRADQAMYSVKKSGKNGVRSLCDLSINGDHACSRNPHMPF